MSRVAPSATPARVVAVVVAHDGERWLPRLCSALAASTRDVSALIAVDTASTDRSRELLVDAFGAAGVLDAPRDAGFGRAVTLALESTMLPGSDGEAAEEWLWLLHDDCAPAPDALQQLLAVGATDERIGVVGCRIRSWPRGRRLLEVGVSIAGSGRRETGLEPGEYDQGQYDDVRDVLAVSSAGMLVRRSVWDELGGFDRWLPLFRDDVDFGWRAAKAGHRVVVAPGAVLFHAEAATREVRSVDCAPGGQHRVDRQAAIFTVLANCSGWVVAPMALRLLVGSILRAIGYLVGKLPGVAGAEVVAVVAVLGTPWRIAGARRRSRRTVSRATVRRLLPPWWTPYANGVDVAAGRLAGALRGTTATVGRSARALRRGTGDPASLESGPVPDEAVNLPTGAGPAVWLRRHPGLGLVGALVVLALIAGRGLWGSGFLQGGALLPAPDGAGAWWGLYTSSTHNVGFGSTGGAAPYVALLGVLGGLLDGKAWLAVDLLMLLAVPIGAVGGYLAAGRFVGSIAARLWMTLSFAVLVVVTGTVTTGHIGTVVATLALPWVVLGAAGIVDASRVSWWRAGWGCGIALAVMCAFAPLAWPMAGALALIGAGWLAAGGRARRVTAVGVALALPFVLLMPWSFSVAAHPARLLDEAGAVDVPGPSVAGSGWHLLLGRLGAVGAAPLWLTAGLALAALAGLLRRDRRGRVAGAWVVVAVSLVTAAVASRQTVTFSASGQQAHAWFGLPVVVAAAAMVAAADLAAEGLGGWMQTSAFGWRQPLAAVTAAAAVLTPLAAVAWWVGVAPHGQLQRGDPVPLPAYMTAAMESEHTRVLMIDTASRPVTYRVLAGDGVRLGDETVLPPGLPAGMTSLVSRLTSGAHPSDVSRLGRLGIGYVVLPAPADHGSVVNLDGTPGLQSASSVAGSYAAWQVAPVRSDPASAHPGAGTTGARTGWLVGQLACWVVAVVMATPAIRRSGADEQGAAS